MAHPNARLTPHGRRLLADRIRAGWTITAAARAVGISRQTGSTWWHRAELGWLADRTSAVGFVDVCCGKFQKPLI